MLDLTTCQDCLFSAKDGEYYQCLENSPDNENFGKNMSPNDFCKYCRRKERKMKEDNFIVINGPAYLITGDTTFDKRPFDCPLKEGGNKMDDLISRQEAIQAVNVDTELLRRALDDTDLVGAEREKFEWGLGLIESCISDIKDLPSKQPERKKGKWIHRYAFRNEREECPESRECSCCGTWFDWDMPRNSFCPNCGADMRGDGNGN